MARLSDTRAGAKYGVATTVVAVVAALYFGREVLIPLAVAVLLAFLLEPVVTWLERWRVTRILAVLVAVGLGLGVLGSITWVVQKQFVEVAAKLPDYRENIENKLRRFRNVGSMSISKAAKGLEMTIKSVESGMPTSRPATAPATSSAAAPSEGAGGQSEGGGSPAVSPQSPVLVRLAPEPSSKLQMVLHYLVQLLSPLVTVGLIVVFVIFVLVNRRNLRDRMIRLAGRGRLNVTTQALDDAASRVSRYLLMQLLINGTYGVCIGVGLWIIGACSAEGKFPNVFLWGMLAGVLRFIPFAGPVIGATAPVVLSLAAFNGMTVFIAAVSLYVTIELVTSHAVEPWLYGSGTGLSMVAVLVSAVFWAWLWGPVGLLLSTPLTVCLVVLGKYVPQMRFLDVLLGDEEVLSPPTRVYQRLLSLDQEEASELLHEYRKEKGLERTYDEVLLPALAMAERDGQLGELDAGRAGVVRQGMRELIEELGEAQKQADAEKPAGEGGGAATESRTAVVLCLPAHDEADELCGLMLAQLLELRGQKAEAVSQTALAGEMLDVVAGQEATVVCISALPPTAMTHARYLRKRLRMRFREMSVVAGLWASRTEPKQARETLSRDGPVSLVTTLAEAARECYQLAQAMGRGRGSDEATERRSGEGRV